MSTIASLARALGGDVAGRNRVLCPGPGHSRADRSLSVTFTGDGEFTVHSFAGDPWEECKAHVRSLLGLPQWQRPEPRRHHARFGYDGSGRYVGKARRPSAPATRRPVYASPDDQASAYVMGLTDEPPVFPPKFSAEPEEQPSHAARALEIWDECQPFPGSLAEHYLALRGVRYQHPGHTETALRFHPACPFRLADGGHVRLPALVAAMVTIAGSTFSGIHRTALAADGSGKAKIGGLVDAKQMLGPSRGAVVKLCLDEEVELGLAISEGIETGLSCQALGYRAVWACLNEGGISRFPVLPGVECLTVFADNDPERLLPSGRRVRPGNDAAHSCAVRWAEAGVEAVILTPPSVGTDFNDILERSVT